MRVFEAFRLAAAKRTMKALSFGFFSVALIVSETIFSTPCSMCFCKSKVSFMVRLLL